MPCPHSGERLVHICGTREIDFLGSSRSCQTIVASFGAQFSLFGNLGHLKR
jgi:hypothetical protein